MIVREWAIENAAGERSEYRTTCAISWIWEAAARWSRKCGQRVWVSVNGELIGSVRAGAVILAVVLSACVPAHRPWRVIEDRGSAVLIEAPTGRVVQVERELLEGLWLGAPRLQVGDSLVIDQRIEGRLTVETCITDAECEAAYSTRGL